MDEKLYYGAAYYPELWDENTVKEDIRIMGEVGINVVRMGEFAWAAMEPEQDHISMDFFVGIIRRLYENGIETVMCTPTPTPPIWVSHGHPERMHFNQDGWRMSHGARQHVCTNNPFFRDRSRIITTAVAKAVGRLPGVIAWQTDNEFKCHVGECMCDACRDLWHAWLQNKYGEIEQLNEAWGTDIWSERYQEFDQVPQPMRTTFHHNASLSTAYRKFSREMIAEFQKEQVDIIRRYSSAPITHNTNLKFHLDNEIMFKDLDFASFDNYPNCDQYTSMLRNYDLFRNVKKGKPFWVMETSPSHNGQLQGYQKPHRNGYLKAEAISAYAMGATGFSFWLWRQQRTGCEQPHGSILSVWGKPAVGYQNVVDARDAIRLIEKYILGTRPIQAELALTYSDRARVFFLTEPLEKYDYLTLMGDWYDMLLETGIHRDILHEQADLEGYKLLMTPFMPYLSAEYLCKVLRWVENGGIWIVGPLTGGRTEEHTIHSEAGLGELEKSAGVETLFSYPMSQTGTTGQAFGVSAPLGGWSTVFRLAGAHVLGVTEGGITPGEAFLTEMKYGDGKIVMLGAMPQGQPGKVMLQTMVNHYAQAFGICLQFKVTHGTVVAPREGKGEITWFIVNMDGNGGHVVLPADGIDTLTEQLIPQHCSVEVSRYGFRMIRFV